MKTPVVLIIFKRLDTTSKVFEVIRKAKPSKLFVIADGPRADYLGETEKCEATRAVIEQVDWDCEVLKNYSDKNLGCGKRVSSGLDWVFEQVEEAIILEDDCVPDPSFFPFCEELLERYKYDNRVTTISAHNVEFGHKRTQYSYYFSRYWYCWGWATWRRAWQHYDFSMKLWQEVQCANLLNEILIDSQAARYWTEFFQMTHDGHINTWDYQWLFACWLQGGLSIIPNVNLVSNIGFDADSTHTTSKDKKNINLHVEAVEFPLKHPNFVIRNVQADNFAQRVAFEGGWFKQLKGSSKKLIKNALTII